MIGNEKFSVSKELDGDTTVVFLQGIIDEDCLFEDVGKITGQVVFNFRDVKSINSCGVRNWVNFIGQITTPYSYAECPPAIVRQLNMVPSFMGSAKIDSIFVPYVCDDCDHEILKLVEGNVFENDQDNVAEFIECEECKSEEMGIDGQPEQYFAFARAVKKAS